jgi:hypothetical protein
MDFSLTKLFSSPREDFPCTPRQVKKWVKELTIINMGETTRTFYEQLQKLNRVEIPAKDRLEILELIRPMSKIVIDHLSKNLTGRTLPLPPQSQKIGQLTQTMTLEMATGYKMVLRDVVQKKEALDAKRLSTTLHRAMRYLHSSQVLSAKLYSTIPGGIWNDINQLYTFAEKNKLAQKEVRDDQFATLKSSSIESAYIQACLFAISRPEALHMGEAQKLADYYEQASRLVNIQTAPAMDSHQGVYVVNILTAEIPQYMPFEKLSSSGANRYLDLGRLQEQISRQIKDQDTNSWDISSDKTVLSYDLARRLLQSWTINPKRRFGRATSDSVITATIGLQNIYTGIEEDVDSASGKGLTDEKPVELALQTIPDEKQFVDYWGETIDHNDTLAGTPVNVWDLVSSGTIVNDEYLKAKREEVENKVEMKAPESWQNWKVTNTSAGGYCLCWDSDEPSKAQVGELIGLREKEGSDHEWRIGTIRWMVNAGEKGLEIGVQLMAPKTLLIEVSKVNNRRTQDLPARALMLPGIKTIQQKPTLILPPNLFKVNDDISFSLFGKDMRVVLTKKILSSTTFTQFSYEGFKQAQQKREQQEDEGNNFDTIWSSL